MHSRIIYFLSFIFMLTGLFTCELEDPEEGILIDDIIKITTSKSVLNADGVDQMTITATLGDRADANQQITFTTTDGSFAGASTDLTNSFTINTSNREAIATLVADVNVEPEVTVAAQVGDFKASQIIAFERAYPDNMLGTLDRPIIAADRIDFATYSLSFFKEIGTASDGALVNFETSTLDSATAEVLPFVYSSNNTASVMVRSANGLPGKVMIMATTSNSDESTISDSVVLEFQ